MTVTSKKQFIIVIVEGPSDQRALQLSLKKIFARDNVRVQVVHGDLTSELGVSSSNVKTRVNEIVAKFLDENSLQKTDIRKIIHLTDTDGTFITDDQVTEDKALEKTVYSVSGIFTKSRTNICNRNKQKSNCLKVGSINSRA